ncbi:AfsR/SARP family transcriptional regulator [Amycolatopsis sp.]|uniref:AfsR/SARP family transcriptional regulator n=1 Tax=Amycolatopsis sp. TaxID=37632 RepID=UPI002D7E3969|nr:AfsR/SARP family transcriptional regulator [Amycolatopsis sp.]HET6710248.1 AfsR/SARP family transcriptional regulator [Amycolatopsis sp.]
MEFEVLGPITLVSGARAIPVPGRLRRILLGVLLADANHYVRADVLAEALWDGDPDRRAVPKLHWHVHKLRSALPERERLHSGHGGYRLVVGPGELDAERFEVLAVRAAEEPRPAERTALIREALGLWHGTPYGGLDVPVLADEVLRLTERRLVLIEQLHQAELDQGRHAAVVAELAGLVRRYPLRERLHYLLMLALSLDGRRAEALDAYRGARRVLVRQLGLEPGRALRDLESRILTDGPVVRAATGPSGGDQMTRR